MLRRDKQRDGGSGTPPPSRSAPADADSDAPIGTSVAGRATPYKPVAVRHTGIDNPLGKAGDRNFVLNAVLLFFVLVCVICIGIVAAPLLTREDGGTGVLGVPLPDVTVSSSQWESLDPAGARERREQRLAAEARARTSAHAGAGARAGTAQAVPVARRPALTAAGAAGGAAAPMHVEPAALPHHEAGGGVFRKTLQRGDIPIKLPELFATPPALRRGAKQAERRGAADPRKQGQVMLRGPAQLEPRDPMERLWVERGHKLPLPKGMTHRMRQYWAVDQYIDYDHRPIGAYFTPDVRGQLLAPPDAMAPLPDGRIKPLHVLGVAKCGTTALFEQLLKRSPHLMPFLMHPKELVPDPEVLKEYKLVLNTVSVKEFAKYVILRMGGTWIPLYDAVDRSRDILPFPTAESLRHFVGDKWHMPEKAPAMVLDGSVFVGSPAFIAGLASEYADCLLDLRWVVTVKDPVKRYESAWWHKWDDFNDEAKARADITKESLASFAEFNKLKQRCVEADADNWLVCVYAWVESGEPFHVEDGFNWYITPGFYAEGLKYAYCRLVLDPLGVPCPSRDDPAIDGLMQYGDTQNRFLVFPGDDMKTDAEGTLDRVLTHAGLPLTHYAPGVAADVAAQRREDHMAPAERAKAAAPGGTLNKGIGAHNEHKHFGDTGAAGLAAMAQAYEEDDARLRRMLGVELPWDLERYMQHAVR